MLENPVYYALLGGLAIALLIAAFTDLRRRKIDNALNLAVALGAPAFWWAGGLALWPDVAVQLALASATFAVLAGMFALGMIGGGDVKLLAALALWIEPEWFLRLLIVMAIAGGVLTLAFGMWHIMRRQRERLAIPYGVAIAFGALWVLAARYLPLAGAAQLAG